MNLLKMSQAFKMCLFLCLTFGGPKNTTIKIKKNNYVSIPIVYQNKWFGFEFEAINSLEAA